MEKKGGMFIPEGKTGTKNLDDNEHGLLRV